LKIVTNKILALIICLFFIGNSIVFPQQSSSVSDTVPIAGINQSSTGRVQIDPNASILDSALNPYNISIPEQFGTIEEVYQGSQNAPLVVHIQNVHSNYEAQVNIKNILNHLVNQYQFSLIQLEGAVSKLDPAILQPSYLKEANLKLVDFLMRDGRITGADAFAVETDKPIELYGIEDYSLYTENLKMFKAIYKHQEELKPFFDEVHRLILNVGPKLLNPELLDFTRKTEEFSTDKIDLMDYLVYMNKLSEKHKLVSLNELSEMVDYPNLTRLIRLKNLEEQLNKAGLKKETDAIKQEFQKKLPDSSKVNELLSHLDGSAKGVNPRTYFLELTKLADEAKIDFIAYPAFKIFAEFLIHQDEIDHRALFSELKKFEQMLQEKLFLSDDEKSFLAIIDYIGLLEQFFRLEMSREKIALYLKDRDNVKPSAIINKLDEMAQKLSVHLKPIEDVQKLDGYMSNVEYFYQLVLKRDDVFIDKILTKTKSLSLDKTIIVTGGFHKDGLIDHFRKEKVSYIVINPKVDVKEGNGNYLKVMLEDDAVAGSVFAGTFALEGNNLGNPSQRGELSKIDIAGTLATIFTSTEVPEDFVVRSEQRLNEIKNASQVSIKIKGEEKVGLTYQVRAEARYFNANGKPDGKRLLGEIDNKGNFRVESEPLEVKASELKGLTPSQFKTENVTPFNNLPNLNSVVTPFQSIEPTSSVSEAKALDEFPLHSFVPSKSDRDRTLLEKLGNLTPVQAGQVYSSLVNGNPISVALKEENLSSAENRSITSNDIQNLPFDEIRKSRLQFFDSIANPGKPSVLLLAIFENTAMAQLSTVANDVKEEGTAAVVYGKGVSKLVGAMNLPPEVRKKIKTIDVSERLSEREIFEIMFKDLTSSRHTYSMYRQYVYPHTNESLATAAQFLQKGYVRVLVPEENPVISPKNPLLPSEIGLKEAITQLFPNMPQLASAIKRPKIVQDNISGAIAAIEVEVLRRIPRNNPQEFEEFKTLLRKYALSNIVVGQGVQWGFAAGVEALLGQISQDMKAALRTAVAA